MTVTINRIKTLLLQVCTTCYYKYAPLVTTSMHHLLLQVRGTCYYKYEALVIITATPNPSLCPSFGGDKGGITAINQINKYIK